MLLTPLLSPQDSPPSTASPPPLTLLPVVQPPIEAPVVSPPPPPTNAVSPVISPPLLTQPPLAPTAPPFLPVVSPPPTAGIAVTPVIPLQPPIPPAFTSPPPPPLSPAITTIRPLPSPTQTPSPPPVLIISSPPHSSPPALVVPSPLLPTIPPAPPPQPSTSLPSTSPLPSPTPPTPASLFLPPPANTDSPLPLPRTPIALPSEPSPASSHSIPNTPGSSFQGFFPRITPPPPSLPLAVGKGDLSATNQQQQVSHSPIGLIVACIGVGILLFLVFAFVCICCKSRRRKQKPSIDNKVQQNWVSKKVLLQNQPAEPEEITPPAQGAHVIEVLQNALPPPQLTTANNPSNGIFSYDELVVATDGFSESNLLGQGGFGYVHKGVLRNGQEVAVKQLKADSQQGEREFQAEVETISRVHHKHLVSLVGYCINGDQRLLVYEFVPNKTLEFHLHGNDQPVIVWENRLKIAIGSAKGIAYLHEDCSPTIIHRDIKGSNILLDPRFEAKVSDFGLAKIFFDASSSITHISTRVVGTFGYLAPEYVLTGKLTDKSDVYSYGVMLLELITGRRPIIEKESNNQSLVDWARPLMARAPEDGNFDTLADPRLQGVYNKSEMASMVSCAAACIRHSAWIRPRMIQVVRALEGDISLPYVNEGTSSWNSSTYLSSETSTQNSRPYENKNKALARKNYGISGYGETSNDYGVWFKQ